MSDDTVTCEPENNDPYTKSRVEDKLSSSYPGGGLFFSGGKQEGRHLLKRFYDSLTPAERKYLMDLTLDDMENELVATNQESMSSFGSYPGKENTTISHLNWYNYRDRYIFTAMATRYVHRMNGDEDSNPSTVFSDVWDNCVYSNGHESATPEVAFSDIIDTVGTGVNLKVIFSKIGDLYIKEKEDGSSKQ